MRILDLSAGNRAVWFNKHYPDATYIDIRPEVVPDMVLDSRNLPFGPDSFDLFVFDPPHVNCGPMSQMAKTYGHHTSEEIRQIVSMTAKEAYRIGSTDSLMAFKGNDHDQKLDKILHLMSEWWEPLFGHKVAMRTKHASATTWVMLRRQR